MEPLACDRSAALFFVCPFVSILYCIFASEKTNKDKSIMIYVVEKQNAYGFWNEIYRGIEKEAAERFLNKISHRKANVKTRLVEIK